MIRFLILAVGIIFLLQVSQAFLGYQLFHKNVALLQSELNFVAESVYNKDINLRLKGRNISGIKYFETVFSNGIDTTKMFDVDAKRLQNIEKEKGFLAAMILSVEESVGADHPINLQQIDSLTKIAFAESNITQQFYSQIVDADSKNVFETTLKSLDEPSNVLYSDKIPLDFKQTKFLRLALIMPTWRIYFQEGWMLVASLLLSIYCMYSFHTQNKNLTKQQKLASLKNEFFSEVSHEFKRPLASLLQAINSLDNEKIILNEEKRSRILRIAYADIMNMTCRTEMFLSLAQDDEGLFELHCTEFDLVKSVFDLVDKVVETTPGPPEIDVDNELKDPIIFGDKDHIEHLVLNLVGNAVKYSKEFIEIYVKLYEEDNNVCISVKDTGIGISAEDLGIIFEKYSRVGKTTHAKGHGIGLNYVKRITEKHGGSVSVKSELNVGSEFIVKLPLIKGT